MKKIVGLAGAGGKDVAQAIILRKEKLEITRREVNDTDREIQLLRNVQEEYSQELEELYQVTLEENGKDAADIFKAYSAIVQDNFFFKKPIDVVINEKINIDYAIEQEKARVCSKFAGMSDPYMKERANDIRNVCDEIIRRIQGISKPEKQIRNISSPFILVAEDLSPEDTVRLNKTYLRGFITEKGGITSHAVILAKTLGIPAVVGAAGILEAVGQGELLFIDGDNGIGIVELDEVFVKEFMVEKSILDEQKAHYAAMAKEPAVTIDGYKVLVCINSGDAESQNSFKAEECDGIGLFRTEFLFMNQRNYPSEEVQFNVYKDAASNAKGKEVIIRTLDIGGDKQLEYMNIPIESNPFLGYRAIRICLDRKEIFLTQLRAILRASCFGNVKVMLPMIVTLEEFREAKQLFGEAKQSLSDEGQAFDESTPLGIMIETPGSVLISDKLAKEVDFFSIGTNDLIQYITATDRMNEKVQYLYDSCNTSVLRAINTVIKNGHKENIPVGMCGEAASDLRLIPLFLAMGLDEFSVVPAQVGRVKHLIRQCNMGELSTIVEQVINSDSIEEAKALLALQASKLGDLKT